MLSSPTAFHGTYRPVYSAHATAFTGNLQLQIMHSSFHAEVWRMIENMPSGLLKRTMCITISRLDALHLISLLSTKLSA